MNSEIVQTLITTLGSIVVAIITVAVKTKYDQRQAKITKEKEEIIQESDLESMVIVQEWLEGIRLKYDFDRVSIFQFHNGGKFFQGKSMKKFSMTYEVAGPGFEKIKRNQQNILASEYPHWISRMLKSKCFVTEADDLEPKDRHDVEALGIKQFVTTPIYCLKGHLIGFFVGHNIVESNEKIKTKFMHLVEDCKFVSGYIV